MTVTMEDHLGGGLEEVLRSVDEDTVVLPTSLGHLVLYMDAMEFPNVLRTKQAGSDSSID